MERHLCSSLNDFLGPGLSITTVELPLSFTCQFTLRWQTLRDKGWSQNTLFNQTVITTSSRGANKVSVPVMPVRSGSFAVPYSKPLSQRSPAQLPEVLLSVRLCHRHSHTPGFGRSLLELHPVHILSGSLGWHQGRVFPPLRNCHTRREKCATQKGDSWSLFSYETLH